MIKFLVQYCFQFVCFNQIIFCYQSYFIMGYGALMSEFVDEFGEDVYTNEEVVDTLKIFVFMI